MEYFVFNKQKKTLSVRDSFTSSMDRFTLKVIAFEIRDGYYQFEFDDNNSLNYRSVYLPIQSTVLIGV